MKVLSDGIVARDDGTIDVYADVVYPKLLAELGVEEKDLDQYWLEVIYQCAKLEVQRLVFRTEHDRRKDGIAIPINIVSGTVKERWQLSRYKPGKGVAQASRGGDARRHYVRLRGFIPNAEW